MNKPQKEYLLIIGNGNHGYSVTEYETFEEALTAEKYTSDWYIARAFNNISAYGRFEEPETVVTSPVGGPI